MDSCQITGLPEGVKAVEYRKPQSHNEYFYVSGTLTNSQYTVVDAEHPQLIVEPTQGYEFRRNSELGCFDVVKLYERPKEILIRVPVDDSLDEKHARAVARQSFGITEVEEIPKPVQDDIEPVR
jgi:hypothetical protein